MVRTYLRRMPKWQRGFVIDWAGDIRSRVADCEVTGGCDDLSDSLGRVLKSHGIENIIVRGRWVGPIRKDYAHDAADWWDPVQEAYPPHTWIEFPDGTILDITADQFSKNLPAIWFPANRKFYKRD